MNLMKTKLFIFLFLVSILLPQFSGQLSAQNILARYNRGALLEPSGKIINGAGQDLAAYNNYWNIMHPLDKPLIYMTYINLKDVTSDWADGLKADLMSHGGKFQIPQIGLSMTVEATPPEHFEQDVASRLLDKQIAMFIDGLESLAFPAYVRIGYEFNGVDWNGYQPVTYKQAFIRITNMIRARKLEVATVWNFAMDGVPNFTDYYPGDAYVDWWSLNLFSASHFTDITAQKFLDSAQFRSEFRYGRRAKLYRLLSRRRVCRLVVAQPFLRKSFHRYHRTEISRQCEIQIGISLWTACQTLQIIIPETRM